VENTLNNRLDSSGSHKKRAARLTC